jgi:hypothetical protein
MGLVRAPLHKETVAEAAEQAGHQHGVTMANAAAIIVVRSVQTLVQAVLDAPKAQPVQFQPFPGSELLGRGAGNEAHIFLFTALDVTEQASRLRGQREANLLWGYSLSADRAVYVTILFVLLAAILRGGDSSLGAGPRKRA